MLSYVRSEPCFQQKKTGSVIWYDNPDDNHENILDDNTNTCEYDNPDDNHENIQGRGFGTNIGFRLVAFSQVIF